MKNEKCRHGIEKGTHCTMCCNVPTCTLCFGDINEGLPGIFLKKERAVGFAYVNWRGEKSSRRVIPHSIYFGSTEWHKEDQWLLKGWDVDKEAEREYAMSDISNWKTLEE